MIILEELFPSVDNLRKYVPSVESNVQLKDLNSSATSARKQIIITITTEVYKSIVTAEGEQCEVLRSALANLTLAKQLIFDVISRRKSGIEVYKYELESMRRAYIDNYFNSMDTLIQLLNNDLDESPWKKSRYYTLLSSLKIKTTEEFDALYPIDLSFMFFFRIVSYQLEVLDELMAGYFDRARDNESANRILLRALAKFTISIALRRLDIIEFPPTIRNLYDDSKVMRNGTQEQDRILKIADQLSTEAQNLLKDVDLILTNNESGAIDTESSFNTEEDLIILMP